MAQTQALGHHQNSFNIPCWLREICSRAREAEVWTVSGERAFQAAWLFYLDNCQVIDHLEGGMDSFHNQWSEVIDLRTLVEKQSCTISMLEIWFI